MWACQAGTGSSGWPEVARASHGGSIFKFSLDVFKPESRSEATCKLSVRLGRSRHWPGQFKLLFFIHPASPTGATKQVQLTPVNLTNCQ